MDTWLIRYQFSLDFFCLPTNLKTETWFIGGNSNTLLSDLRLQCFCTGDIGLQQLGVILLMHDLCNFFGEAVLGCFELGLPTAATDCRSSLHLGWRCRSTLPCRYGRKTGRRFLLLPRRLLPLCPGLQPSLSLGSYQVRQSGRAAGWRHCRRHGRALL